MSDASVTVSTASIGSVTQSGSPKRQDNLLTIQMLRALAAILVTSHHAAIEAATATGSFSPFVQGAFSSGQFGVDIFFVVSGFIMMHTSFNRFATPGASFSFLRRRIIRIVPLYWLFATIFLVLALGAREYVHHTALSLPYIICSYVFIPFPRPGSGLDLDPFYGLGWTLNFEMYFYVVFAVFLTMRANLAIYLLALYFVVTCVAGHLLAAPGTAVWLWSRANILEFLAGALIAYAARRGHWVTPGVTKICVALAILLWVATWWWSSLEPGYDARVIMWGVPATLLVMAGVSSDMRGVVGKVSGIKWLAVALGDASYSLYLSHMLVVRAVSVVFWRVFRHIGAHTPVPAVLFIVVATVGSCILALGLYRFLERPLTRGLMRLARAA